MSAQKLYSRSFMEWLSMAEQLHASLTSHSTMASIKWSGQKCTTTGLQSSGNLFCEATNQAYLFGSLMGWDWVWQMPRGHYLAIPRHFGHCMLLTLWEQFGKGPFLFQHNCVPQLCPNGVPSKVHKWLDEFGGRTGPHISLTSTPSNTFEMNWNGYSEPGLLVQHQGLTSQNALLDEWSKNSYRNTPKSSGKPSQKSGSCYSCIGRTNIVMSMYLECDAIKVTVGAVLPPPPLITNYTISCESVNFFF